MFAVLEFVVVVIVIVVVVLWMIDCVVVWKWMAFVGSSVDVVIALVVYLPLLVPLLVALMLAVPSAGPVEGSVVFVGPVFVGVHACLASELEDT